MSAIYERHDPSLRLFLDHETPQVVFGDGSWNEGPCYFPASRSLIWSDIPNDRLMRFDEISGQVCVFRPSSNHSNGNTVDRFGRLVTCEHGARRITRTEFDGSVSVLADTGRGRQFNSPNDAVVKSDGSIWFSDPSYGIDSDYFGIAVRASRTVRMSGGWTRRAEHSTSSSGRCSSRMDLLFPGMKPGFTWSIPRVPRGPNFRPIFVASTSAPMARLSIVASS